MGYAVGILSSSRISTPANPTSTTMYQNEPYLELDKYIAYHRRHIKSKSKLEVSTRNLIILLHIVKVPWKQINHYYVNKLCNCRRNQ